MARIVCLGSALQDVYLQDRADFVEVKLGKRKVFGRLELGDKVNVEQIEFAAGGGGTNIAVGLARGGHKVWFWGTLGRDVVGRELTEVLGRERVNLDYTHYTAEHRTGYSTVMLAPSGERTILTYRGASADFGGLSVKELRAMKPDWLSVTTTYGNLGMLRELFADCAELGVHVMWNPGKEELKHRREVIRLLDYVDVLLLNRKEAGLLLDREVTAAQAAKELDARVDMVIVTDGSRGLVGAREGKRYKFGLYADVRVVDTTGAGDAFGSGFLTAYAHGVEFAQALVHGAANSTAVVQKIGAKAGLLKWGTKIKQMKVEETV
jgi:sugar/nucleoside kinase (ribokinase family)